MRLGRGDCDLVCCGLALPPVYNALLLMQVLRVVGHYHSSCGIHRIL